MFEMKTLVMAVLALCAFCVVAEPAKAPEQAPKMMKGPDGKMHPVKKIDRAKLEAAIYKRTGGKLKVPGSQQGRIVYVNCQKSAPADLIQEHAAFFAKELKMQVDVVDGVFDLAKPNVQGNTSLFIVDDPKLPMSLVAPESKWAVINIAPLKTDKEQFFKARVKKELTRVFCYLNGAVASQYPMALTECVSKPEDLDKYMDERLPFDIMQRFATYLAGGGVTPYRLMTYKKACQEGWAPQPTNDIQKAIWDDVHQLPTKPLKIEPEMKPLKK